jgi:regulator of sigma E protease
MIGSLFQGKVPEDVAGPVGMFKATSAIKETQGFWALLHFFGIISVNLAIVNILPFPALDGGRIIFVIYEWISGRRANEKFEIAVNNFGYVGADVP